MGNYFGIDNALVTILLTGQVWCSRKAEQQGKANCSRCITLEGGWLGTTPAFFTSWWFWAAQIPEEEGKQQRPYRDTLREHLGQVRHGILFQCLLSLHALLKDQHAACALGDWIWIRKTAKAKTPLDSQTSGDFLGKRWKAAKFSSWKSHGKRENLHAKGAGLSVCASCIPLPRSRIHLLRYSRMGPGKLDVTK